MRNIIKRIGIVLACIVSIYIAMGEGVRATAVNDSKEYVLLGANDLGMHCIQQDYSSFMILPPANNIRVQVFEKGQTKNRLVTDGIKVSYEMIDNTTSVGKSNFWQYAKDYGYNVSTNIGITGNGLAGEMKLSEDQRYFEATAVPVTPYNDGSKVRNPYQLVKVTVTDTKTGKELAMTDKIVVPVSDEMDCGICHGENNTDLNILKAHDKLSGTSLVADLMKGERHKCADCHEDNAIGEKGKEDILPLSEAIHAFHADKVEVSPIQDPVCYSCHPGVETQCYRGVMKKEGIACGDEDCHGGVAQVAKSQSEGRQAWLQEPNCQECHGEKYANNEGKLYRNSYLNNSPAQEMNGKVQCISCHNGPHAEWESTLEIDNKLPESIQGEAGPIEKCSVCHNNKKQGKVHHSLTKEQRKVMQENKKAREGKAESKINIFKSLFKKYRETS
nr:cytochrome c3 family protein [uncultured Cellulosilyticum sp.]